MFSLSAGIILGAILGKSLNPMQALIVAFLFLILATMGLNVDCEMQKNNLWEICVDRIDDVQCQECAGYNYTKGNATENIIVRCY